MNKLIIVDGETEYIINTAQDLYDLYNGRLMDLYDLYNGWLMDFSEEEKAKGSYDYEIVSGIREYYQFIFDNIKKTKYDLAEFEVTAFGMI